MDDQRRREDGEPTETTDDEQPPSPWPTGETPILGHGGAEWLRQHYRGCDDDDDDTD